MNFTIGSGDRLVGEDNSKVSTLPSWHYGFEEWRIGADGFIAKSQGHFDSDDYRRQLDGG